MAIPMARPDGMALGVGRLEREGASESGRLWLG